MIVSLWAKVPIVVEVDTDNDEVVSVHVIDDADIEFENATVDAHTNEGRGDYGHDAATDEEKQAAETIADSAYWPAWEFGF